MESHAGADAAGSHAQALLETSDKEQIMQKTRIRSDPPILTSIPRTYFRTERRITGITRKAIVVRMVASHFL